MSSYSRKCPMCGGHRTVGQKNVWQCLDSSKKHPDYPFFNKDGAISNRDGLNILGYKQESINQTIYIAGYNCPWPIPTHVALYITENSKDDLESFEKLCKYIYDTFGPSEIFDEEQQKYILSRLTKMLSDIETHIRTNTSEDQWIVCGNVYEEI